MRPPIAAPQTTACGTMPSEYWASAAHLRADGGTLADALRAAALDPRDIQFRIGAPAVPPPATGRFLDRAS